MEFKVAICDDETIICERIKEELLALRPDYLVDIYGSGEELIASEKIYDYIFLDIQMPGIGGMETARTLRRKNREDYIIFLTSHTEYMPEAFKVRAFRFLNKPLEEDNFREAVEEIEKEILNNEKIILSIGGEHKLLNFKDLVCFEAFGDGTYIHTKSGILESNQPLRYWEKEMGSEHFFRVHKSYIVALRYVGKTGNDSITLQYVKSPVPVSRRRMKEFKETFFEYVRQYARLV